jgi:hypothetical protein
MPLQGFHSLFTSHASHGEILYFEVFINIINETTTSFPSISLLNRGRLYVSLVHFITPRYRSEAEEGSVGRFLSTTIHNEASNWTFQRMVLRTVLKP